MYSHLVRNDPVFGKKRPHIPCVVCCTAWVGGCLLYIVDVVYMHMHFTLGRWMPRNFLLVHAHVHAHAHVHGHVIIVLFSHIA